MTSTTVANNVPTPQAPTAELSWDAIMAGQFTTSPARRLFEETVISRAASAKAALPSEANRIDRGRDLVLANRVMLNADGSFVVHSTSERGKSYPVTDSRCTCPDADKAPEGRCKHVLSTWIWRKARSAVSGQELPPTTAGASNGQHAAQEAPGATNGTQAGSGAIPQEQRVEENVEESVALAASFRPSTPGTPPAHSEAPASMNTYVAIGGYKVQVTLRGDDEQQLLLRMGKFLSQFPPTEPAPPASTPPASTAPAAPPVPEGWCRRHDLQMTQQHNAKGSWWSHRLADGSWCKGK